MARLHGMEMRMVCWMSGVSLKEHWLNESLQERIGIESVDDVLRRNRLSWFGHLLRKGDKKLDDYLIYIKILLYFIRHKMVVNLVFLISFFFV